MKRLQSASIGSIKKQAEPLTMEEEEQLWEKKILGDHSPKALSNTMMFINGIYFPLQSWVEHHQLRHYPSQIQLVENPRERAYLIYREDTSKNHPGGLKGRKQKQKMVFTMLPPKILVDALYDFLSCTMSYALLIAPVMPFIWLH